MDLGSVINGIAARVPTDGETYMGAAGLLLCSRCHTPRQSRITLPWDNRERLVYCVCKCMEEADQRYEAQKQTWDRFSEVSGVRIAGFPAVTIQQFTFDQDDGKLPKVTEAMKNYVQNFPEMRKQAKGLLLYGNVGTGKTFAGGCVVNALEEMGYPCLMTSVSRLSEVLFGLRDGRQRFLDNLLRFDLVLIDDLGVERETEFMSEQVYTIVDNFYRAEIPMIITSNYTPKQLTEVEDIRKKRVFDRLLGRCHPVLVDGPSRRKETGRHDFREMNKLLGL